MRQPKVHSAPLPSLPPPSPLSLDPNDQKSLEGMQKMEKEESPTDATVELDGDDMEGSGEDGDLEGSDSEAAQWQWADQEQWFGTPSH